MPTSARGRIPICEAWVGEPNEIFGHSRGSFMYEFQPADGDTWPIIQKNSVGVSIMDAADFITLKPTYMLENTRLPVAYQSAAMTKHSTAVYDYYTWLGYTSLANGAGDTYDTLKEAVGGDYFDWVHNLTHVMKPDDGPHTTIVNVGGSENTVSFASMKGKTRYHLAECAPDRHNQTVRLSQNKPTTSVGDFDGKWSVLKLLSEDKHPENPSIVAEFEFRSPPEQSAETAPVWSYTKDQDGVETKEPAVSTLLQTPFFTVTLSDGTAEPIMFRFATGETPVAVRLKDRQKVEGLPHLACNLRYNEPMRVVIRYVPPGYYVVSTNFIEEPWVVQFQNKAGMPDYTKAKSGKVGFGFYGMGSFMFAWAPLRYWASGFLVSPTIDRGFSDDKSSGLAVRKTVYYPKDSTGESATHTVNHMIGVNSTQAFPSTETARVADNRLKDKEFYLNIGLAVPSKTVDSPYTEDMEYWDSTQTPYLARVSVQYVPKPSTPSTNIQCIGSLDTDVSKAKYATSHIKNCNINSSLVNFWRTTKSGSLTVTNNQGEWNHMIRDVSPPAEGEDAPTGIQWTENIVPMQMAIKIYFRWITIDDRVATGTSNFDLHQVQSGAGGNYFNPDDTADDQYCIFTGWITNKGNSVNLFTQTVTFQLKDRMYQLQERKIINSPFYDGTLWRDSVVDVLKFGGLTLDDIDMVSFDASEDKDYVIPLAPAAAQKPQFKFAFGTSPEKSFDELHNLVQVFVFLTGTGKLKFLSPADLLDIAPITFYDTMAAIDIPDDSEEFIDDYDLCFFALSPFQYSQEPQGVYNRFIVGGPELDAFNRGAKTMSLLPRRSEIVDKGSIEGVPSEDDPEVTTYPENFLGYPKEFFFVKPYLTTDRSRNEMCRKLYEVLRLPQETVSWSSPLVNIDPYTRVEFTDSLNTFPKDDRKWWLVSNSMSYDAANLWATSNLQARTIRGLLEGFA